MLTQIWTRCLMRWHSSKMIVSWFSIILCVTCRNSLLMGGSVLFKLSSLNLTFLCMFFVCLCMLCLSADVVWFMGVGMLLLYLWRWCMMVCGRAKPSFLLLCELSCRVHLQLYWLRWRSLSVHQLLYIFHRILPKVNGAFLLSSWLLVQICCHGCLGNIVLFFLFFFTVTRPRTLNVRNRKLTLSKACGTILDTTFDELCDRVSEPSLFLLFFHHHYHHHHIDVVLFSFLFSSALRC